MSTEAAVQWVVKLHENEELRKEAEAAGSFEARQALAKEHGFEFTKEEVENAFKADEELSDDDLDAVSGGVSEKDKYETGKAVGQTVQNYQHQKQLSSNLNKLAAVAGVGATVAAV